MCEHGERGKGREATIILRGQWKGLRAKEMDMYVEKIEQKCYKMN